MPSLVDATHDTIPSAKPGALGVTVRGTPSSGSRGAAATSARNASSAGSRGLGTGVCAPNDTTLTTSPSIGMRIGDLDVIDPSHRFTSVTGLRLPGSGQSFQLGAPVRYHDEAQPRRLGLDHQEAHPVVRHVEVILVAPGE